jgi:hypothetical protein
MKALCSLGRSLHFLLIAFMLSFLTFHGEGLLASDKVVEKKKKVLVVRKAGESFEEVSRVLQRELSQEYIFVEYIIRNDHRQSRFDRKIKRENPNYLVLMDNRSVYLARSYNERAEEPLKGLALMGLNYAFLLQADPHLAAITYEAPAYTLMTRFRYLSHKELNHVTVFYRKSLFESQVSEAKMHLAFENVQLNLVNLEEEGLGPEKIKAVLKQGVKKIAEKKERVDAVWLLLDSSLLTSSFLTDVWIPFSKENSVPILTGARELLSTQLDLAVFAVTPNLFDLGTQAAGKLRGMIERPNRAPTVELPFGVDQFVNLEKAQKLGISIQEDRLQEVSKVK